MVSIRTPEQALDHAVGSAKEVELTFPSDREAKNFRWRMYQIRATKIEWAELRIALRGSSLVISKPIPIEVVS